MCGGNDTIRSDNTLPDSYRFSLLAIYAIVLVGGSVSVGLMIGTLKSNIRSVTTMAVVNLIVVHSIFLLSVPFRIYYYIRNSWQLGATFCKLTSGTVHGHMYVAFIFYVIVLVARALSYYQRTAGLEFYRRLHALAVSVSVWVIMLCVVLPFTLANYGSHQDRNETQCFNFGRSLGNERVEIVNYVISTIVLVVSLALGGCQLHILWCVYRRYGKASLSHQEFCAQIKSMCFVLVILFCFVPYHAFRIYYVCEYKRDLENKNEIFLAFTSFCCFDMLTFVSRWGCRPMKS